MRTFFRRATAGLLLVTTGIVVSQELGGPVIYQREISQRIAAEIEHTNRLPRERKKIVKSIADVQERIGNGTFLDKLQGNNVLLVFVESYGRTALVQPRQRELLLPKYHEAQEKIDTHASVETIVNKLRQSIAEDPAIAASVLRTWLEDPE